MKNKFIYIINDRSSQFGGGRSSFLRNIYKINPGKLFIEISASQPLFKNPKTSFPNVEYIRAKSISKAITKIKTENPIYVNCMFKSKGYFIDDFKSSKFDMLRNRKIWQQHGGKKQHYNSIKTDDIESLFDDVFLYSKEDNKKSWKFETVKINYFLLTGDIPEPDPNALMKKKRYDFLYSGRSSESDISSFIDWVGGHSAKVSTPTKLRKSFRDKFKDKSVTFISGDKMSERYSEVKVLYQPENKGYGVAILEALFYGIPSIIDEDFDCSKFFLVNSKFLSPSKTLVDEILKKDFYKACIKKSLIFINSNSDLSAELFGYE